jgi:hypothetical protein
MNDEDRSSLATDRRMAALFLLALALIVWQALRTKPLGPPPLEISTLRGEQLLPVAVPPWRPDPVLSPRPALRLAALTARAVRWPERASARAGSSDCQVFVRMSSQHWALRPASMGQVSRWLGPEAASQARETWRRLRLPVASFLDDDDGDGDLLDAGELRSGGPGAEVEAFCGDAARSAGDAR